MAVFGHTPLTRLANRRLTRMVGRGRGPSFIRLLTVTGRRTGRPHTTPVVPVVRGADRWLVAAYGEVGWVRNARAAGVVTLSRGDTAETLRAVEVGPAEAVPVLRAYRALRPAGWVVRSHLAFGPRSSDAEIAAVAARHPVFRLVPR
ncbi:nitroreductase/quinone reductase family protein [Nocardioides sp.]|uniref:nitroreductase/quinone reductase family protein n=1 Tax=Nocardioides sp. TaxID=35761 RepID=UPI002ED7C013